MLFLGPGKGLVSNSMVCENPAGCPAFLLYRTVGKGLKLRKDVLR
jgi:hypothetical protein